MRIKDLTRSLLLISVVLYLCSGYGDDISVIMTVADKIVDGTIDVEISSELFKKFYDCLCDNNTKACNLHLENSDGYTVRAERASQNIKQDPQDTEISAYYKCALKRSHKIRCTRLHESWELSNFVSSTSYRLSNISCDLECTGFVWFSNDENIYFYDDTDLYIEDCEHERYGTSKSPVTSEVSTTITKTTTVAASAAIHTSEVTVTETVTSESNFTTPIANPRQSENNMGLVIGVTIGLIVLLILVVIVVIISWRRKRGMTNSDHFYRRTNNLKTLPENYVNPRANVSPDLLHSVPKSVAEQNAIDTEHNKTSIGDQYLNCGNILSSGPLNSLLKAVRKSQAQFHSGCDGNVCFDSYENHRVLPPANSYFNQFKLSSASSEVDENSNDQKTAPLSSVKPAEPEFVYNLQKKTDNLDVNMAQKGPKLQMENEIENPQIGHKFDSIDCPEHLNNSENTSNNQATASPFLSAEGIGGENNDYGYSSIDTYYEYQAIVDDSPKHRSAAANADILPSTNIYTDLKDNYETVDTLQEDNTAATDVQNRSDDTKNNHYSTIEESENYSFLRDDDMNSSGGYAHLNHTAKKVTNPYNILPPAGENIGRTEPHNEHTPSTTTDYQKSHYSLAQPITEDSVSTPLKVVDVGSSSSTKPGTQSTTCSTAKKLAGENPQHTTRFQVAAGYREDNYANNNRNNVYFELEREGDVVYPIYN